MNSNVEKIGRNNLCCKASFAQQTETDLSHKRSFASLKMTSTGHSEQCEESHKLDCFANNPTTAMRFPSLYKGGSVRNDVKEIFPRPLRLCRAKQLSIVLREGRVRVRGNDSVIADRATLVRNDENPSQPSLRKGRSVVQSPSLYKGSNVRNDETTLVPQYLSALVPFKKAAFTKPSRGTSDSERRTIINGNHVFRFDCERCRLTRGAAFTLAEVLITLGIIGVVAAITMPSLIQNYKDMVLVNQTKKVYSNLYNALNRMRDENGYTDYADMIVGESAEQLLQNIAKYYNGSQVCSAGGKGCGSNYRVKLASPRNDGYGNVQKAYFDFPRMNNVDGSSFYTSSFANSNDCLTTRTANVVDEKGFATGETTTWTDSRCAIINFDVNGQSKGPNQYGADVFQIDVYENKIQSHEGYYGSLNSVLTKNKLNYTKYSDDYEF